jgi:hypothetical protein
VLPNPQYIKKHRRYGRSTDPFVSMAEARVKREGQALLRERLRQERKRKEIEAKKRADELAERLRARVNLLR